MPFVHFHSKQGRQSLLSVHFYSQSELVRENLVLFFQSRSNFSISPVSERMEPPQPLRILTIDGAGLQGVSTLLILNELLEAIAKQNGVRRPRPCDVFDTIAGIGAGGWVAIFLGRFRMGITSCLLEWYKIIDRIAQQSILTELRLRLLQHCHIDPHRLVEQVEKLTKGYGSGEHLFEPNPEGARTRHAIIAAQKSDTKGYNIFRSYETPTSAKIPEWLREGPANPGKFKISSAFGVTGASRYFTPEWESKWSLAARLNSEM